MEIRMEMDSNKIIQINFLRRKVEDLRQFSRLKRLTSRNSQIGLNLIV